MKFAQEKVDHLSGLVDKCIDHCRRNLAHELNPPILKKKDFASALKWAMSPDERTAML